MQDLRKVVPPDRVILDDITLAFLPGAKIGVLGANGAGKSSLLRIMAGVDKEFLGEARPADGLRVGFLPQEPQLDPAKDVLGNVEEGVAPMRALLRRFEEISAQLRRAARRRRDGRSCSRSRRSSRTRSTRANAWELDRTLEIAMDALRCPPRRRRRRDALGRRAAPRGALPAAAREARPAAARRADQPPRRRVGRVARALPAGVPGHRRRRHPRSLLPRQRRRLDPRARPRPRHPVGGQLLLLARAEAEAPRASRRSRRRRASARSQRELEWVRMSPRARQAKSKARIQRLRGAARRGGAARARDGRDHDPAGPAPRRRGDRGEGPRARATATAC